MSYELYRFVHIKATNSVVDPHDNMTCVPLGGVAANSMSTPDLSYQLTVWD